MSDTIAGALLLAALVEAQGARAEGIDARMLLAKLSAAGALGADDVALLHLAVALEAPQLLTEAELAELLDADTLIALGLAPEFVADLLDDGVDEALQRLKDAFGPKLKAAMASAERKLFAEEAKLHKASAQGESAASGETAAAGAAAAGAADAGMSPLALLLGAAGIGAIGVAVGGGGGGDGNSPASLNNAPTASNDTVAATEDAAVTFDVRSNDSDPDGNPLSVTAINGTAITTTAPVTIANVGTVALNAAGTLTFTPVANYNGTPTFTYTLSDGRGGTATGTVNLTVSAVNDAPVNTVPATSVAATAGVAVAVGGLAVADVDGGNLTTTLSLGTGQGALAVGAVAGGATITGSGTASVTITGTIAQVNASLGAVTFTSGTGFSGNATLTVSTSDGTATDVDTRTIAVARVQTGVVSDGYIVNGTVFIDINGNGVLDSGEPTTTTNASGAYSFASNAVGPIVAFGGTNADTGLPNLVKLTAPVGSTVVNPLTTIVQSLVATGVPAAQATMQVAVALGLPATTDLGSYDILAKPANDPVAIAAQKAATQIVTLLNTARDAAGTTNAASVETLVVAKLAAAVTAGGSTAGSLDLTSTTTLTSVLTGVQGIPPSAVMMTVAKTAAVNQVIEKAADLGAIATSVVQTSAPNVNLAPATTDDAITTASGQPITFDVRGNDVDIEGDALSVTAINGAALQVGAAVSVSGGAVLLNANGTLTFRPDAGFSGSPTFTYTVTDARGASGTGTVNATVTAPLSVQAVTAATLANVVANADALAAQGVTTLDVDGAATVGALTLTEGQAATLIDAGLEFADNDVVTMSAAATHLSNNLQSLQALGVDSIAVSSALAAIDIDSGSIAALIAGDDLPQFDATRTDGSLDVTLNVDGFDGDVTEAQFITFAGDLGDAGVDHLDFGGVDLATEVELSDVAAAALVAAGLDIADGDVVTVEAAGTHLSTTLQDLQDLGVDSVSSPGTELGVELGGAIDGLAGLPQFDIAQTDGALDVTLEIGAEALTGEDDIGTLLGVDVLAGLTTPDLYGDLIDALLAAGIDRIEITAGGRVQLTDGLAEALGSLDGFEAGGADLVLDATGSGDHLLTSLRDMAELGVDAVELDDQGSDPVYVDLGDGPIDADTLLSLLDELDSDGDASTPLFSGTAEVALVVDQNVAEALATTSGAVGKWDPLESTCRHASLSIL